MSKTIQFKGTITIPDDLLPQDIVNVFKLEANTQDAGCCQGYAPAPPPKKDLGKYAGKFVFIERNRKANDTPQTYSNYYNGEYFCIRSSQNTLYLIKPAVGYGGQEMRTINTFQAENTESYSVLSVYEDDSVIRSFVRDQEAWLEDTKTGKIKKQWIDAVYAGAESVLRQVNLALENK